MTTPTPKPFDDPGTEMARRRTGMSFQRTRMSADRTLMAVMRTSLSLIGFGFTIEVVKVHSVSAPIHGGADEARGSPRSFDFP